MNLDVGPDPSLETGQQLSEGPSTPDPVEALSRTSGISPEALAALSEHEFLGMQEVERTVTRTGVALESGQASQETYDAAVAARDQIRAEVEARVAGPPDPPAQPTGTLETNRDQAPPDARLTIRNDEIVVDVAMHLYGASATQEWADRFERDIETVWNRDPDTLEPWTYTDAEGNQYAVRFDAHVDIYDEDHPERGPSRSVRDAASNRDNYFEVVDEARAAELGLSGERPHEHGFRPNVRGGDYGQMRGFYPVGESPLIYASEAAHEFGHLLGFKDRYTDREMTRSDGSTYIQSIPHRGYERNIMGTMDGNVSQDMIDRLLSPHVARRGARQGEFRTTIDNPRVEDNQL